MKEMDESKMVEKHEEMMDKKGKKDSRPKRKKKGPSKY